jgi:hypothetical protein
MPTHRLGMLSRDSIAVCEAVARGVTGTADIAVLVGRKVNTVRKTLDRLESYGYVEQVAPISRKANTPCSWRRTAKQFVGPVVQVRFDDVTGALMRATTPIPEAAPYMSADPAHWDVDRLGRITYAGPMRQPDRRFELEATRTDWALLD